MSQFENVIYPTASVRLDAGMYTRQQLQDALVHIEVLDAKVRAAMQPKKEWVGLTKEDVESILEDAAIDDRGYVMAMTEAKLKEKNGG
jgi:hypothetical protein